MPEADYAWLPRESMLSFEEIARLADVFADLGADRVRLTGGEPLLRRDLRVADPNARCQAGDPRSRPDHQRRAARAARGGAPARRPPADHGQPGHAASRSLRGAHALRRARRGAGGASTRRWRSSAG